MAAEWTLPLMQDAKARYEFILVSPGGPSRVAIVDAQRLWMNNPAILFQTGYRIAGTEADIATATTSQGVSQEDLTDLLNTVISVNNYDKELAPIYLQEMTDYQKWRRATVKSNIDSPGAKLFDVMAAVNPEILTRVKTAKQAKAVGLTKVTTGRGKAAKPLIERITALAPGKVLDVSKLDPSGTGAVAADVPTRRSKKYGHPNLRIISSDLDHYLLAIRMLPGGETQYSTEVEYMKQLFGGAGQAGTAILPAPGATTTIVPTPIAAPPTTTPVTMIPAPFPVAGPQPIEIPRGEDYVPTRTYPLYTKGQRQQMKKAKEREQAAAQGLAPRVPAVVLNTEADALRNTVTGILNDPNSTPDQIAQANTLMTIINNPTDYPNEYQELLRQQRELQGTAPQQIYIPPDVRIETEEDEDEESDEDSDSDEEDELDEEDDEENGGMGAFVDLTKPASPVVTRVPHNIPLPQMGPRTPPTVVLPQPLPTRTTIPVMPNPRTVTIPSPRTGAIPTIPTLAPRSPTMPTIPTLAVGPRSPTLPVIPTLAPRSPTVPVIPTPERG